MDLVCRCEAVNVGIGRVYCKGPVLLIQEASGQNSQAEHPNLCAGGDWSATHVRILIYSANFAPEQVGIGKYSGEMACWLAQRGHTLRIVAAPPYYPAWKLNPEYRRRRYRREQWRGMAVWRAPLWVPKSPGGLKRILHLVSFAVTSFPLMMRHVFWRPDIVITVAPAFVCAPAGWLTARLSRAKAWLHVQDFEVDIAFELNLLKSKLLRR